MSYLNPGPNGGIGILAKINAIQSEMSGYLAKDKKNNDQGYKYVTELAFLAEIRPLLVKHGVVLVPTDVSDLETHKKPKVFLNKDGSVNYTIEHYMLIETATVTYSLFDTEDGSSVNVKVRASGADQNDKASYKLNTGASKYVLFKAFNVATGDDPENDKFSEPIDSEEVAAPPRKSSPVAPKAAPKPAPAPVAAEPEEDVPQTNPPEEDAPPPSKKPAAAPKPAPAPAKAAPKKAAGPFSGDDAMVDDLNLNDVYTDMAAQETPEDIARILSEAVLKVSGMKKSIVRKRLQPYMQEFIQAMTA